MIWERVPFPERIITLLAPSRLYPILRPVDQIDTSSEAAISSLPGTRDWHFRYVVQPREPTIFAPLAANREARNLWRQKLEQPKRRREYLTADGHRCAVRFAMPYINYESDIFTMLFLWDSTTNSRNPTIQQAQDPIDPFLGLNRERIENIGIGELGWDLETACLMLSVHSLPHLRTLSLVSLGPSAVPPSINHMNEQHNHILGHFPNIEMAVGELPSFDCEIRNVTSRGLSESPFFNGNRLYNLYGMSNSTLHILDFRKHLQAWLYHAERQVYNRQGAQQARTIWWAFSEYLEEEGKQEDLGCPLPFEGCGKLGHSRKEAILWRSNVTVQHKFLCATKWKKAMDNLAIFE